jgi:hypothetical protein
MEKNKMKWYFPIVKVIKNKYPESELNNLFDNQLNYNDYVRIPEEENSEKFYPLRVGHIINFVVNYKK